MAFWLMWAGISIALSQDDGQGHKEAEQMGLPLSKGIYMTMGQASGRPSPDQAVGGDYEH